MKTTIIIPAFNEESTIGPLLEKVIALPFKKEVILSIDGIEDRTLWIAQEIITHDMYPEHKIIAKEKNMGKGHAIRYALPHATGDITLICDADLELEPEDINYIDSVISHKQVVYGSRFFDGYWHHDTPFANRLCNYLLAKFVNLLWPSAHITDEATAYKAFRTDLLKSLPLTEDRFGFCPEVTALVLNRGITIYEVPISYAPRSRKDGKKVTWKDGVWAFWVLLRERMWKR